MVETAAQAEAVGRICGAVTAAFSAPAEAENHNWRHDFAADRFQMLARHGALDRYFGSWFLVSVVAAVVVASPWWLCGMGGRGGGGRARCLNNEVACPSDRAFRALLLVSDLASASGRGRFQVANRKAELARRKAAGSGDDDPGPMLDAPILTQGMCGGSKSASGEVCHNRCHSRRLQILQSN